MFTPGQLDYIDELNRMLAAFNAGPYNALPLTGGTLTGDVVSTALIRSTSQIIVGDIYSQSYSSLNRGVVDGPARSEVEVMRLAVGASSGVNYGGCWNFLTSAAVDASHNVGRRGFKFSVKNYDSGSGTFSPELFSIDGAGTARIPLLKVNSTDELPYHVVQPVSNAIGDLIMTWADVVDFRVAGGSYGNTSQHGGLRVTANAITGRGINTGGTINASGADYAEYLIKALLCGTIAPGQIVGIDADGKLTDKWDRAVTFVSKSTNPCMVGGDTWAQELGARPSAPVREMPVIEQELVSPAVPADEASGTPAIAAVYRTVSIAPGDADEEWAAKEAAHAAEVQAFDAALETLRQTVDRIAFAGQVPVNVFGATPGQYIVPVQDGDGIAGMAMDEDDMNLKQYMRSIGKVIAIEGDGRARIIVRVA
jgi:hypothetical protein